MQNKEIRDFLAEICPDAVILDNPSFDNSIIGVTWDDRIAYSFEKMMEELSQEDGIDTLTRMDIISYDTMRKIPYAGENAPVVIQSLPWDINKDGQRYKGFIKLNSIEDVQDEHGLFEELRKDLDKRWEEIGEWVKLATELEDALNKACELLAKNDLFMTAEQWKENLLSENK